MNGPRHNAPKTPHRKTRAAAALACAVVWLSATTVRAEAALDRGQVDKLFVEANDSFRRANAAAAQDPQEAQHLYRDAAMRFERIAREGQVHNGGLYYNIGNAYFRLKDVGRAILYYRRAEQFIAHDPNLRQNLDYARARKLDKIEEAQRARILRTLFFWHYDLSTRTRAVVFAMSFVTLWSLAGIRLFLRKGWLAGVLIASQAVTLLTLGSLTVESYRWRRMPPGVVIEAEVAARKGDSETYEPSFKEPLHAGTEFTLVERRPDWYHIALDDGRQCWVPKRSVALIHEEAEESAHAE
jgi:tetratricopeptide (TPR) repeat protein